ncbi:NmrA family protein [Tricladium varicosporioides]|nr:NmrA family protein [Hymenoscyphus varicosporioides]
MSTPKQTVLIIGGTGAQGVPVVKELTQDSAYAIRLLTRSASTPQALELARLPNVTIIEGNAHNEADLHSALEGVEIVFANTNGFAIGEKAEIYWGIRLYELSREHKIKHFIWGSLESSYEISGYQPRFRTGHFDGKAKVTNWMKSQDKNAMAWSALSSCLYLEMLNELTPFKETDENGQDVWVFKAPLGQGKIPLIYLVDLGKYVRWLIDNRERANGMDLKIATEHVGFDYLAKSFTEVTGKRAKYQELTIDEYFALGQLGDVSRKIGPEGEETRQTFRENFSGFWNTWREDVIVRDMNLLDEILPGRVKSVGEWMRLTGYTGERSNVLKDRV